MSFKQSIGYNPYFSNEILSNITQQILNSRQLNEATIPETKSLQEARAIDNAYKQKLMGQMEQQLKAQEEEKRGKRFNELLNSFTMTKKAGIPLNTSFNALKSIYPEFLDGLNPEDIQVHEGSWGAGLIFNDTETGDKVLGITTPGGEPKVMRIPGQKMGGNTKHQYIGTDEKGTPMSFDPVGNKIVKVGAEEGINTEQPLRISGRNIKPLPSADLKNINGAFNAISLLDTIERNYQEATNVPVIGEWLMKGKARLGKEGALAFKNSLEQLKVLAQDIIKGIPSNFDVQNFINSLPKADDSEQEVLSKVKMSKGILMDAIKTGMQNYGSLNYNIPPILQEKLGKLEQSATPIRKPLSEFEGK